MVGERVWFLFTSCEESQTNEWAQRTSKFSILSILLYEYWDITNVYNFDSLSNDCKRQTSREHNWYRPYLELSKVFETPKILNSCLEGRNFKTVKRPFKEN